MKYQVIHLNDHFPAIAAMGNDPTLSIYLPDNMREIDLERKRPSILICPGGGYTFASEREAEPVALAFMGLGYNAFTLKYTVAPARYPTQAAEAAAAVALIRRNAEDWNVNPDAVLTCGFSAGAHLAGSVGLLGNSEKVLAAAGIQAGESRVDGMILSYPVISGFEHAHRGSFDNLLGDRGSDEEALREISLECQVTDRTPPVFLWHTSNDDCVPIMNSLLFAQALSAHKIPFEYHVYDKGSHGLSLANEITAAPALDFFRNPAVEPWLGSCAAWLKRNFPMI